MEQPVTIWPATDLRDSESPIRGETIAAMKQADLRNYGPLIDLHKKLSEESYRHCPVAETKSSGCRAGKPPASANADRTVRQTARKGFRGNTATTARIDGASVCQRPSLCNRGFQSPEPSLARPSASSFVVGRADADRPSNYRATGITLGQDPKCGMDQSGRNPGNPAVAGKSGNRSDPPVTSAPRIIHTQGRRWHEGLLKGWRDWYRPVGCLAAFTSRDVHRTFGPTIHGATANR